MLHGKLHVGFGFLPIHQPDLVVRPLMQEPLVACLPAGHRLIVRQSVEPEELENEPMIAVARKSGSRQAQGDLEYFEGEGIFLKFASDAYLPKEALWLVSRGLGVALMTRSSAVPLRPDVVLRPLSNQFLTVKSGIFALRDHHTGYIKEYIEKAWAATAALRPKPAKTKIAINSIITFVNGQHDQLDQSIPEDQSCEICMSSQSQVFFCLPLAAAQEAERREFHEGDQPISCETRRSLYGDHSPVSNRRSSIGAKGTVWDRAKAGGSGTGGLLRSERYDGGGSRDAGCPARFDSAATCEAITN